MDSENFYFIINLLFNIIGEDMSVIIPVVIVSLLLLVIIIYYGYKAQILKPVATGNELLNSTGEAMSNFGLRKKGKVRVNGEIWKAISDEEIKTNDEIVVISYHNFILKVKKVTN